MSTYRSVKDIAKTIRENLKKELPRYKFSVTSERYSHITVSLMSGPLPVTVKTTDTHLQLNPWAIKDERLTREGQRVMAIANRILSAEWWDKSEPMIDYFCCAYYRSINIGKWDKPYTIVRKG